MNFTIRPLADADRGYVLSSWRESLKQAPGNDKVPWAYFKAVTGVLLTQIVNDPTTKLLGAYNDEDKLLGFLAMTPGKRINTLHWVQVKFKIDETRLRRRGLMTALLGAAELGPRFIYTLHARRDRVALRDGTMTKSLDETLAQTLGDTGVVAVYTPLKQWLK